MEKAKLHGLYALSLTIFLLGGCATTTPAYTPSASEDQTADQDRALVSPSRSESRVQDGRLVISADGDRAGAEMLNGMFYFDFDQAIVKRTNHAELNKHARALKGDGSLRLRLEGHADERGTREYNLALGERRAIAVGAYLMAQGASRAQFEVISYGEEKPVNATHSEAGWVQNRRVEIVYR